MKKALKIFGVVILILLIVPVVLPTHFSMSRSIEINAPVEAVFTKLTDLNEYVKWNPFQEGDPTNKNEVTGLGGGSFLVWKGEKTGEGKMTIISIESPQKIGIKLDFLEPLSGEATVHWITNKKSDGKTEMIWTFDQDLPYFSRYFGLCMDSMMGGLFEKGLSNFKTLTETSK